MGKWDNHIAGVYKLTFPDGKIYIGKSLNIKARFSGHKRGDNANHLMNGLVCKVGWDNIKKEILFKAFVTKDTNQEELNKVLLDKEREYIKKFQSNNLEVGYNLYDGGIGTKGYQMTDEHKRKLSESHVGLKYAPKTEETRRKLSLANKGKKPSTQCIEAARKVNIGKKASKESLEKRYLNDPRHKRIASYNKNGELVNVYFCLKEAAKDVDAPYQGIQRVLKGELNYCRNLKWVYYEN